MDSRGLFVQFPVGSWQSAVCNGSRGLYARVMTGPFRERRRKPAATLTMIDETKQASGYRLWRVRLHTLVWAFCPISSRQSAVCTGRRGLYAHVPVGSLQLAECNGSRGLYARVVAGPFGERRRKPVATLTMINETKQASALAGEGYRLWRVGLHTLVRAFCPISSRQSAVCNGRRGLYARVKVGPFGERRRKPAATLTMIDETKQASGYRLWRVGLQ